MESTRTTTLRVEGMTCENCVRHVREALAAVPGVSDVAVSLPDSATIRTEGEPPLSAIATALEDEGYQLA